LIEKVVLRECSQRLHTTRNLETAARSGSGYDSFCRSALDSERLTHLWQRARSIGEQRKEFEFVSEKYGREAINTEDHIPYPSLVRSRSLYVDRRYLSHAFPLRVVSCDA